MAAPKGNKYALGHNWGRPPKYESARDMSDRINEYFDSLIPEPPDDLPTNEDGTEIPPLFSLPEPPTVTGLALFLGFASRQSIYDYSKKGEDFSYIIKRALLVVENHYEMSLNYKNPTGAIFALKNMDWSDKREYEHNGNVNFTLPSGKDEDGGKSDPIE